MITKFRDVTDWFRSPWVIAGLILQASAFPLGYWIVWKRHLWFDWMMPIVTFLNPDIDAPDNWAMAATYSFRLIAGLLTAGMISYCVALWRQRKEVAQQPH